MQKLKTVKKLRAQNLKIQFKIIININNKKFFTLNCYSNFVFKKEPIDETIFKHWVLTLGN